MPKLVFEVTPEMRQKIKAIAKREQAVNEAEVLRRLLRVGITQTEAV